MADMHITVGYGKANLSTTVAMFSTMRTTAPFIRDSAATTGRAMGDKSYTPVGTWKESGTLISCQVGHPTGTVVMVMSRWMRGAVATREGAIFVRLRSDGPLWSIIAKVPTGPETTCGDSFQMFAGRGDIMNLEDLELAGITVPPYFRDRYTSVDELGECFRLLQNSPELAPRPSTQVIMTPTGEALKEVANSPRRRIKVRRQP